MRGISIAFTALVVVALLPATAQTRPPPAGGAVASVWLASTKVSQGANVDARIGLVNFGDIGSVARPLLVKLKAPNGKSNVVVARERIPPLAAGRTATLDLNLHIPDFAKIGSSMIVVCRQQRTREDACGFSRQTTLFEVLTPAHLTMSPEDADLGTQAVGTSSTLQTYTLTNDGEGTSGVIDTSIGGPYPGQFTKTGDRCEGQTLAPSRSCTIDVGFTPTEIPLTLGPPGIIPLSGIEEGGAVSARAWPGGAASGTFAGTLIP